MCGKDVLVWNACEVFEDGMLGKGECECEVRLLQGKVTFCPASQLEPNARHNNSDESAAGVPDNLSCNGAIDRGMGAPHATLDGFIHFANE